MKHISAFFSLLFSASVFANSISSDFKTKLDSYLNSDKYVGLSILVLTKNGEEFVSHYGKRDISNGLTPDSDTLYEIGSISKAFTRISLAGQSKIQLDDNIATYLPNLVRVPAPLGEDITIENLITHTGIKFSVPCTIRLPNPSDLKCFGFDLDPELIDPYRNTSKENNYKFLTDFSYTVEEFAQYFPAPGIFWSYSNIGIGLVGEFLGEQHNATFEDYLKTSVLAPLEMSNTKINMPCEQSNTCQNMAKVYSRPDLKESWKQASLWHLPGISAAGGIRSSINDMKKFLKANLSPETTTIQSALETAQSPLVDASNLHNSNICNPGQQPQIDLCNRAKKDFYYAWEAVSPDTVLYHGGATGASQAMMMFSIDRSLGVVVLSNSKVGKGEQTLFHYPNDVALCAYQLLGKNVVPGVDFCARL